MLDRQSLHGYRLIQEIADRSNSVWKPSPGSIYPSLQQLEEEGLISFERIDVRTTATLTDVGKAHVDENRGALGTPWDGTGGPGGSEYRDLKAQNGRAQDAIAEIQRFGTEGYLWVLDADIEACFDSISHSALMDRVRVRVKDKRVLALVKLFLKAGIMTESGNMRGTHTGTPQGRHLVALAGQHRFVGAR